MDGQARNPFTLDWRWIVAGYCYLVLFHLLPTYLLGGLTVRPIIPGGGGGGSGLQPEDVMMIWLLGGVAIVAFVVGWRSKGITILEPAVAGVLYAITITLTFHELASSHVRDRPTLAVLFWLLIVVIVSVTSACVGEAVQGRKSKTGGMNEDNLVEKE